MDSEYHIYKLGSTAFEYVKKHLSYGHTLAQYLLTTTDIATGEVVVALPKDSHFDRLYSFDQSILEPPTEKIYQRIDNNGNYNPVTRKPIYYSYLVDSIRSYLNANPWNICIIQDYNAKPHDAWLSHYNGNMFTFGAEIYHPLTGADLPNSVIEQAVERGHSWTSIGFFTSWSQCKALREKERKEITQQELFCLAERIQKIYIGAYDFEAFLIWNKKH